LIHVTFIAHEGPMLLSLAQRSPAMRKEMAMAVQFERGWKRVVSAVRLKH
jgi:hypothetical protein